MASGSQRSETKHRFEKKSEFHFIEHRNDQKKSLNWYAEWQRLNASVYEIEIVDTFHVCEQSWNLVGGADLTVSMPPGKQDRISKEEKKKFINLINELRHTEDRDETEQDKAEHKKRVNVYNNRFRIPDIPRLRQIVGKCSLQDHRGLGLIEDGQTPSVSLRGFGKGRISLRPGEGQYLGFVGVHDENDLQWNWTGEPKVGDLWFEFHLSDESFDDIVKRIQETGPSTALLVSFSTLAFQSEVERSLAEPYHWQTYYLEKGKYSTMGSAVLESIHIVTPKPVGSEPIKGYRDHTIPDEYDDPDANDWPDEPLKDLEQPAQESNKLQNPIKLWPLTLALWAVFFGLLLNALQV